MPKHIPPEVYKRAETYLPWNAYFMAFQAQIQPNWIADSDQFWFFNLTPTGYEFLLVDCQKGTVAPAFDHDRMAKAFSFLLQMNFPATQLPFASFAYTDDRQAILVHVGGNQLRCDLQTYQVTPVPGSTTASPGEMQSPDKQFAALVKEQNIWIRSTADGTLRPLTQDGEAHYGYGTLPECSTNEVTRRLHGKPSNPLAIWSPDSGKLLTFRLDERKVREFTLTQHAPEKNPGVAISHTYRTAIPGDMHVAEARLCIIDVNIKSILFPELEPQPVTFQGPIESQRIWWSTDSRKIYFIFTTRGDKTLRFYEVDGVEGKARMLLEETSSTWIAPNLEGWKKPNVKILEKSQEFVWFSERDGWGHLYLYALDGTLKHQITRGSWVVREVLLVDENERQVYFTAGGLPSISDPYYCVLCRIGLDGQNLTILSPEDADHTITLSPSMNYFMDQFSRPDTAPRTVIRDRQGSILFQVAEADLSILKSVGWNAPEPYKVKAADGETDLYGLIYFPSDFDPQIRYPVINGVYPGPQAIRTSKHFPILTEDALRYWEGQVLAELGFIVVTVDGRGTPLRERAFSHAAFGKLDYADNLADNIAAIKNLADKRPYMDIARVGIYGHSAGGAETVQALLTYPDFFKAGFASAGPYDLRAYLAYWGERFQGLLEEDNYLAQAAGSKAGALKGKLFLAHGEMDDNVPPAQTLLLADALIKANKDFELLLVPNRNHATLLVDEYFHRKMWDFFVTHLAGGALPPESYHIQPINPTLLAALLES